MTFRTSPIRYHLALVLAIAGGAACGGDDDDDGAPGGADVRPSAGEEFFARATGVWRRELVQQTPAGQAWVTQTLTVGAGRESLLVEAFGDEARTVKLLTYDSGGPCEVVGASAAVPDAFELDLRNDRSLLTVYVDDAAFLAGLGLDDCGLVANETKDISNGCGAPIFAVTNCVDLDLFQVARDGTSLRTGAPGVDRCVERPAGVDPGPPYLLSSRGAP